MCLYPRIIKNRKYVKNKKNQGVIPMVKDKRALYVPVGCGNCMECMKQKAREWQVRLHEEIRHNKNAKFVTLTFSEESLIELENCIEGLTGYNLDNQIATLATRRFLERWRKKYKKSLRHWLVTELGQTNTERIHIHGLVWTDELADISLKWKYGHINIGKQKWNNGILIHDGQHYVSERTINYIVKYVNKKDEKHKEFKPKILTSSGIGRNYLERWDSNQNTYKSNGKTRDTYKTRKGIKLSLPIYYRNKIYTDEEKELLWMEKLDKEERWVNGIKIDVSESDETYFKVLEEARKLNKRLGYGDNEKNWERIKYENDKRNLLKQQRGKNLGKRKAVATAGHEPIDMKQDEELVKYSIKTLEIWKKEVS